MLVFEHLVDVILQESLNPNQSNFQKEKAAWQWIWTPGVQAFCTLAFSSCYLEGLLQGISENSFQSKSQVLNQAQGNLNIYSTLALPLWAAPSPEHPPAIKLPELQLAWGVAFTEILGSSFSYAENTTFGFLEAQKQARMYLGTLVSSKYMYIPPLLVKELGCLTGYKHRFLGFFECRKKNSLAVLNF